MLTSCTRYTVSICIMTVQGYVCVHYDRLCRDPLHDDVVPAYISNLFFRHV